MTLVGYRNYIHSLQHFPIWFKLFGYQLIHECKTFFCWSCIHVEDTPVDSQTIVKDVSSFPVKQTGGRGIKRRRISC